RPAVLHEPAAQLADAGSRLKQVLRRHRSPADDVFGVDRRQLTVEVLAAVGAFVLCGRAVPRRAAFQDVADVDLFALQPTGRDNVVEQLSCAAYKGLALGVFVGAGRLTDEKNPRLRTADAEDRLRPRLG